MQSLGLEERNNSMSVTGIHCTNSRDCWKLPVKIGLADEISNAVKILASSYTDLLVDTSVYNVIVQCKGYLYLSYIRIKNKDLKDVKVILLKTLIL